MPIDASIPLQVQGMNLPSPAQLLSLRDLAQRAQMNQMAIAGAQRKQRADQELRTVFSDPTNRDDKGNLKPEALGRIDAIDPSTGMAMRKDMALAAQREAQTKAAIAKWDNAQLDTYIKKNDMLHGGVTGALSTYKEAVGKGIPEPEARRQAQEIYSGELDSLRKSGVFSEDELKAMPLSFDPKRVEAGANSMLKAKGYFDEDRARRAQEAKAPTMRTRVQGTNEVQEEWDPATKTWKQVGQGPRFKPTAGGEDGEGKPLTDIAKLNADFKAGRITKEQYDDASKKKTGSKAGLTVADKMNPVMLATVRLDIREMDNALENMTKGMSDVASPFFADKEEGNALVRMFKKKATPENMQLFDAAANRVSSALASIQSMGRGMISDEKIKQAQKMIPVMGDTAKTREFKIAQLKKFGEFASEILKQPIKEGARGSSDDVQDMLDFWEK